MHKGRVRMCPASAHTHTHTQEEKEEEGAAQRRRGGGGGGGQQRFQTTFFLPQTVLPSIHSLLFPFPSAPPFLPWPGNRIAGSSKGRREDYGSFSFFLVVVLPFFLPSHEGRFFGARRRRRRRRRKEKSTSSSAAATTHTHTHNSHFLTGPRGSFLLLMNLLLPS